jgi:hypothetical protein
MKGSFIRAWSFGGALGNLLLSPTVSSRTDQSSTQDIGDDNILINFVDGPRVREGTSGPFRCHFPVRYYLNDFEFAVCFAEHSSPTDRLVSGTPIHSRPIEHYGRIPAPEMLSGRPYCPFKCDVWQMGTLFCETFNVCDFTYTVYWLCE